MTSVRILGVDPGFDRLGVCLLEKNGTEESLVHSACFVTSKTEAFEDRLLSLGMQIEDYIKKYRPDHLAIETLFVTKNQKTAMLVASVRGMIIYIARKNKLSIFEYSPPQIKSAITGYGQAKKEDVAFMVSKILKKNLSKNLLDDEVDAIAISLTHSAHYRSTLWK